MTPSTVRTFTMAAGGHAANAGAAICEEDPVGDGLPSVLLKPLDLAELEVYQRLTGTYASDPVHGFVPAFHGVSEVQAKQFLRMGNLLHGFSQPKVMDVKLGKRTFLHAETRNTKARADLFQKMLLDFPSELTASEHEAQIVTKSRYMSCRDAKSTSGMFGYRVSGTAGCYGGPGTTSKYRASVSETDDAARHAFRVFATSIAAGSDEASARHDPAQVAQRLAEELRRLRSALNASPFVRHSECVGTSALLVADAETGRCRVFWIDFAKTCPCEHQQGLSHRAPLSDDTQEEGFLSGLDNLIVAWECVAQSLRNELLSTEVAAPNCCKSVMSGHATRIRNALRTACSLLTPKALDPSLLKGFDMA